MLAERQSWPDMDGVPVSLGDWVHVFCSWSRDPKFDGRPVQIVDVLRCGRGVVYRLRDPELDAPHFYLVADGHGYRRAKGADALN